MGLEAAEAEIKELVDGTRYVHGGVVIFTPRLKNGGCELRFGGLFLVPRKARRQAIRWVKNRRLEYKCTDFSVELLLKKIAPFVSYRFGDMDASPEQVSEFLALFKRHRSVRRFGWLYCTAPDDRPAGDDIHQQIRTLLLQLKGSDMKKLTVDEALLLVDSHLPSETAAVKNIAMTCLLRDHSALAVPFESFVKAGDDFCAAVKIGPAEWRSFLGCQLNDALASGKVALGAVDQYLQTFAAALKRKGPRPSPRRRRRRIPSISLRRRKC